MTAQVNQALPWGLPAAGLPQRDRPPTIQAGGTNVTITTTPTTVTISVNGLALINGGQKTTSFDAAVATYYAAEGSGITATGPASANVGDIIAIAVGSTTITFAPNGLKVNASTSSIPLLPFNTYIMSYTGSTSGWC